MKRNKQRLKILIGIILMLAVLIPTLSTPLYALDADATIDVTELKFIHSYFDTDYELFVTDEYSTSFMSVEQAVIVIGIEEGFKEREDLQFVYNYYDEHVENELPSMEVVFLLHEIGHTVTITEELSIEYYSYVRLLLPMLPEGDARNTAYRQIPAEKLADEWAFKILENNFREVDGEIVFVMN